METRNCCAHNLSKGCSISSRVTVADSLLEPLKVLRTMVTLAIDSQTSLWLTPLLNTPMMTRLFPFDLVYLDSNLRVIEAVELVPEAPFPPFDRAVASALILPHHTVASTGVGKGDELLICAEEEFKLRHAEVVPAERALAPVSASATETAGEVSLPLMSAPAPAPKPFIAPRIPVPLHTGTVAAGTGFTVSLTTSWRISSSTMAATLPEVEAEEEVPAIEKAAVLDPTAAAELAESSVGEEAVVAAPQAVEETAAPEASPEIATPELSPEIAAPEASEETLAVESAPETVTPEEIDETAAIEATTPSETAFLKLTPETDAPEAKLETVALEAPPPQVEQSPDKDRPSDSIPLASAAAEPVETKTPASELGSPAAGKPRVKKDARNAPAIVSTPRPSTPETKSQDKKKDPLGTRVIRWLNLEDPPPERRSIIRLLLQGLQAYDANGDGSKRYDVRDLCPPGFYLRTREKWQAGEVVSLVLEKTGATGNDHERRVTVQARVVRCDNEGFGFEFVFPEGTEFRPWERVRTKRSDETEADFILRELRLARALGFLQRVCPSAAPEIKHALHDRLSNKRVASSVEIALKAEASLARNGNAGTGLVHPNVVMRIIENGSWIEDDWIRGLWAGILVSAHSADGQDTSNLVFMDLLAKLNPIHLRILTLVCRKGAEAIASGQSANKLNLYCTAEELMGAADSHSFARIQQSIGHLSTSGLIAETSRPSYVQLTGKEKTRTVPTPLGMEMYARLNGRRQ